MPKQDKILYRLEKDKARTFYLIKEDSEEPTFIYSIKMDKNGEKSRSMVILKDLPAHLKSLTDNGWVII